MRVAVRMLALTALLTLTWPAHAGGHAGGEPDPPPITDRDAVFAYSQAALGRQLGEHVFLNAARMERRLSDYRGKPLVVNMLFTGCTNSCPMTVQALAEAARQAERVLGPGRFSIVSIGFDSRDDTPERLRAYARSMGAGGPNWEFLAADTVTVESLVRELGFVFAEAAIGFEHIAQVSVVDAEGRIYQQIYGADFEPPALVEPVKALLLRDGQASSGLGGLIERIKLFCTSYNAASGRYSFNYSILIGLALGGLILTGLLVVLVRLGIRAFRDGPPPAAIP